MDAEAKKQMENNLKALAEVKEMLSYLHNKRGWVSLNTLRNKFPVVSRNKMVFEKNGISKKLIGKNTYYAYNSFIKWWRPMRECMFFDICSCNNCPLDEKLSKREILQDDPVCLMEEKGMKNVPKYV